MKAGNYNIQFYTGSSTACVISLNASSGVLRAAKYVQFMKVVNYNNTLCSVGDSGFSIIRSSEVIYKQPPQTHHFNFPRYVVYISLPR